MLSRKTTTRGRWGLPALALVLLVAAGPGPSPVADAAERDDLDAVKELLREGADVNAAQADGMTALHWAAVRNHPEMVEILLYAGATVRARTRLGGYSPLHLAARNGSTGTALLLLEAGADPDARTTTGVTALHFAAEADAADLVRALSSNGADVNAEDGFAQRTPLMFASSRNATGALAALLESGADPATTTRVKDYEAIEKDQKAEQERRERIRAAADPPPEEEPEDEWAEPERQPGTGPDPGADPPAEGGPSAESRGAGAPADPATSGEPPAQPEAAPESEGAAGDHEPAEAAWTHPDSAKARRMSLAEQIGRQGGFTALHYAAREGHREAVQLLLEGGADVNQVTAGDHSSPLLVAVINGNYDVAKDLLDAGADPNLVSDDGVGPLFATLNIEWSLRTWYPQPQAFRQQETRYLELMERLLDAGANPNQRTTTHVWYASYNAGRMGVDFTGATPFWRAAYAVDVAAMRLLAERGADPDIWTMKIPDRRRMVDPDIPNNPANDQKDEVDYSGLPPVPVGGPAVHPLHAAAGVGFGTSRVAQQHRAAPGGWLPAIRYLVEELGIDPNLRDLDGFTALHHAAARGDNATILYLVEKGADVSALSRQGHTTADMANSPEQRAQPLPATVALLEKLGSLNSHQCQACGGATRSR